MSEQTFDRRKLLGTGLLAGAVVASTVSLRAVLGHEGESHGGTPAAATPGATPEATPAAADRHVVEMTGELQFVPDQLTIKVGDTVEWRNVSEAPHTSTCDPDEAQNPEEHVQLPEAAEPWNSGTINPGDEFERTFDVPGEYTYFCIPHEAVGMVGHLTVDG